jgi:hypothetical protein
LRSSTRRWVATGMMDAAILPVSRCDTTHNRSHDLPTAALGLLVLVPCRHPAHSAR